MKLKEAQAKIKTICNIPFADIFEELDFPMIIKNKGKTKVKTDKKGNNFGARNGKT